MMFIFSRGWGGPHRNNCQGCLLGQRQCKYTLYNCIDHTLSATDSERQRGSEAARRHRIDLCTVQHLQSHRWQEGGGELIFPVGCLRRHRVSWGNKGSCLEQQPDQIICSRLIDHTTDSTESKCTFYLIRSTTVLLRYSCTCRSLDL